MQQVKKVLPKDPLAGDTLTIDECPKLSASLGKIEVDRIRYHQKGTQRRQSGTNNVVNTVRGHIEELHFNNQAGAISGILTCAARIDENSRPLNRGRLFNLFLCMPLINSREVQLMMDIDTRQAKRYVRAAKFALPFLVRHFEKAPIRVYADDLDHPFDDDAQVDELPDLSQFSDID